MLVLASAPAAQGLQSWNEPTDPGTAVADDDGPSRWVPSVATDPAATSPSAWRLGQELSTLEDADLDRLQAYARDLAVRTASPGGTPADATNAADAALGRTRVAAAALGALGGSLGSGDGSPADLEDVVATVEDAAGAQAEVLGAEPPAGPVVAPASTTTAVPPHRALGLLADQRDVVLGPASEEAVAALDAYPPTLRAAILDLLDAFLVLDEVSRTVYGDSPAADPQLLDLGVLDRVLAEAEAAHGAPDARTLGALSAAAGDRSADDVRRVDAGPVLQARDRLLRQLPRLQAALAGDAAEAAAGQPCQVQLPPLISIDRCVQDNVYRQDFALLVDAGGNDTYLNNAGGNGVGAEPCSLLETGGAALLVDLAGDDVYGDAAAPRSCGANGGGYLGAGVLVDAGGRDRYFANNTAVNGGGVLGLGLLVDAGGDDLYRAGVAEAEVRGDAWRNYGIRGVNGGALGLLGVPGAGLVVDTGGDDVYFAGVEHLVVDGSEDHGSFGLQVVAGSGAVNGGAAGVLGGDATGLVVDTAGSDRYAAGADRVEVTGNRTSVHLGGLANGAALSLGFFLVAQPVVPSTAAGGVLDGSGDDRYEVGARDVSVDGHDHTVTTYRGNGAAWGLLGGAATGVLRDRTGADVYRVGFDDLRVQGTWNHLIVFAGNGYALSGWHSAATAWIGDDGGRDAYEGGIGTLDDRGAHTLVRIGWLNAWAIGVLDAWSVALVADGGGGDDTYRVGADGAGLGSGSEVEIGASNAAALSRLAGAGVAVLRDQGGHDVYSVGVERLTASGDARIVAGAMANAAARGEVGGVGLAALFDGSGDDRYLAGVGEATLSGTGTRLDAGTNGANGGASASDAAAAARIHDGSGHDEYVAGVDHLTLDGDGPVVRAGTQGANGGAGPGGATALLDAAGDDRYLAGIGVLVDLGSGSDVTAGTGAVNGGADRGHGLLLDLAGTDTYRDATVDCTDCSLVPKGTAGAQVDSDDLPP